MNKILLSAMFLMVGLCAFAKEDKKIVYVGDGRYVCQGSDCGEFRARERQYQERREESRRRDGYNEEREQRQRERDSYGPDAYQPRSFSY